MTRGPVCDTSSVAELQAQQARELAERKVMSQVLSDLGPSLDQLARNPSDSGLGVAAAITRSAPFKRAAAMMPREAFEQAIRGYLGAANAPVDELTEKTLKHMSEHLLVDTAQTMKKKVTSLMTSAAQDFRATAENPERLELLARTLSKLGTSPQGESLRERLGLEKGLGTVTTDVLAHALRERAGLLSHEAKAMSERGENTLYRSLLTQDVSAVLRKELKLEPDSWAAQTFEAVKARGEADERVLEGAKLASAIVLAGVTGGVGGGWALSAAGALAVNAPEVAVAYHEVDAAAAGASAGSAANDAASVARHNANMKALEAGASTVMAGVMGVHAAGHAASTPAKDILTHMGNDAMVELPITAALHLAKQPPGEATGENALAAAQQDE